MKRAVILIVLIAIGVLWVAGAAQALRVTLKRVVFEGAKRAEVLTVINGGSEEKTYRVGWKHFRMTPDKSLVAVPDDQLTPDIKPVVDMIRFAPRRFSVAPGSSQQVRMMLRTPAGLPDGEYRSHLWVRSEVAVEELKLREKAEKTGKNGVFLRMLTAVTMPIIVRKGALQASLTITDLTASESAGFITTGFALRREGNKSVYGDLRYMCGTSAESYELKITKGVSVYTEVDHRNFNFRIEKPQDKPRCNTLTVTYTETNGFMGENGNVLAEGKTQVN